MEDNADAVHSVLSELSIGKSIPHGPMGGYVALVSPNCTLNIKGPLLNSTARADSEERKQNRIVLLKP
jgi:hypothetical protein